jgi:hypothetical protein
VPHICRHRIDADGEPFTDEMADLLTAQRRFDEAAAPYRERADAGDPYAVKRLAPLLVEQGCIDETITMLSQ